MPLSPDDKQKSSADAVAVAQFHPLDAEHTERVLVPAIIRNAKLWSLTPVFVTVLALSLLTVCYFTALLEPALMPTVIVPIGIIGLSIYRLLTNYTWPADRYLRSKFRDAVAARSERSVDPDNPQTVFVDVVPRENWTRRMKERATDAGFLFVDLDRREIRFEGDKERCRIPGAAVVSCEIEEFLPLLGTRFWEGCYCQAVVLRVLGAGGMREIPFSVRSGYGLFNLGERRARARELCRELRSVTGLKADGDLMLES